MSIVVEEDEDDDDIDGLNDSFVSACSDLVSSRDPAGRRRRRGSRSPTPPSHWSLIGVLVFPAIPLFRFRFRFGSSPLFSPRRKAVATIRFCFLLVLFGFFVWSLVRFPRLVIGVSPLLFRFYFGLSPLFRHVNVVDLCGGNTQRTMPVNRLFVFVSFAFFSFLLCSIVFGFCGIQGAVAPTVGSVPRRIVVELRHFHRLLKMHNQSN